MNLSRVNKRAQEGVGAILRWILYLGVLAVAIFAIRNIFLRFRG